MIGHCHLKLSRREQMLNLEEQKNTVTALRTEPQRRQEEGAFSGQQDAESFTPAAAKPRLPMGGERADVRRKAWTRSEIRRGSITNVSI